jgi:hypothetical protein
MAPNDTEKNYEKGVDSSAEDHQMLEVKLDKGDVLPSPVSATARPAQSGNKSSVSAAAIIPVWIVLSSTVIIYNNYLYNTLHFKYPVFLVTWHLTFAVSATVSLMYGTPLTSLVYAGHWHPGSSEDDPFT